AWNAITNGASLIQLYSAMVFQGPSVVGRATRGIKKRLAADGFTDLQEAVGYSRT
ncbi:TPA: dihydroorotate dehydrogenase (quinone), partial [Candidatus Thalassarchaeaceae archaeon]